MNARAILAASLLTAAGGAGIPVGAQAAGGPATAYDFTTRQTDPMAPGEVDGRMHVVVTADGILNGTYTAQSGDVTHVTGGLTGTKIWFEIGNRDVTHDRTYTGTFVDGKIDATAAAHGLHSVTFVGTPAAH